MGNAGVRWVMQGSGGWVMVGWSGSCRDGVQGGKW